MKIRKFRNIMFYKYNYKQCKELIESDKIINAKFRKVKKLTFKLKQEPEWKYIALYRKYQSNHENFWGLIYKYRLKKFAKKYGIDFEMNTNIGKGLIIGHWGRIIINKQVVFGDSLSLTHGVTIGRDVRGKRVGTPIIGSRVCVKANSTIVGKVVIGDDVMIAPNTFVNFDVPSHSIVVGNPATIHRRDNATEGYIPEMNYTEDWDGKVIL